MIWMEKLLVLIDGEGNGFVDQHNGDIVFYGILAPAGGINTHQCFIRDLNGGFAIGTGKDLQQIRVQSHRYPTMVPQLPQS